MDQEYKPNFDEMSEEEREEFFEAWKEANKDWLDILKWDLNRPKKLMANPAKMKKLNDFLGVLAPFVKGQRDEKRAEIEIKQHVTLQRDFVIDVDSDGMSSSNDPELHEQFIKLLQTCDSFGTIALVNDRTRFSFVFEDYYIELT